MFNKVAMFPNSLNVFDSINISIIESFIVALFALATKLKKSLNFPFFSNSFNIFSLAIFPRPLIKVSGRYMLFFLSWLIVFDILLIIGDSILNFSSFASTTILFIVSIEEVVAIIPA